MGRRDFGVCCGGVGAVSVSFADNPGLLGSRLLTLICGADIYFIDMVSGYGNIAGMRSRPEVSCIYTGKIPF